jgi:hypothetical protein
MPSLTSKIILDEGEHRFLNEYLAGSTMESIAKKEGISKMRVSQVVDGAGRKIRKEMGITPKLVEMRHDAAVNGKFHAAARTLQDLAKS